MNHDDEAQDGEEEVHTDNEDEAEVSDGDGEEEGDGPGVPPFGTMDPAEGALFLQLLLQSLGQSARDERDERASSHDELVGRLSKQISEEAVGAAFDAIDRGYFVGEENMLGEGAKEMVYSDRPYRGGIVHLSAPSIYVQALEALELRPGLSFLNIGSGTGYFSALAAHLLGPHACHHAVEVKGPLADHSRRKLSGVGLASVSVHHGSLQIDCVQSMRFDRIWVGAGATADERALCVTLLREGGIAVGPFENARGAQALEKLVRIETVFDEPPAAPTAPEAAVETHTSTHTSTDTHTAPEAADETAPAPAPPLAVV